MTGNLTIIFLGLCVVAVVAIVFGARIKARIGPGDIGVNNGQEAPDRRVRGTEMRAERSEQ